MDRRELGQTVRTSVPGTKRYALESTFDSVGQDMGVTRQEINTTLVPARASQVRGHADTSRRPGAWAGGVDSQCGRRTSTGLPASVGPVGCLSPSGHDRLTITSCIS